MADLSAVGTAPRPSLGAAIAEWATRSTSGLGRRVRDGELVPDGVPGPAGVQVYWGVPDASGELARLTALRAEVHEGVKDVGGGIKVASVRDPFGNLFGIIENPHFKVDTVR